MSRICKPAPLLEPAPKGTLGGALPFLCESALAAHDRSGAGFAGRDPFLLLQAWPEGTERIDAQGASFLHQPPLDVLRTVLDELRGEEVLAAGYFGYELGGTIERLPGRATDDQRFPLMHLAFYEEWTERRPGTKPRTRGRRRRQTLSLHRPRRLPAHAPPVERNFTREGYIGAVRGIRDAIERGDVYQVNLSQRFSAPWDEGPLPLYRRLRKLSPAPYAAMIDLGAGAVISSSPEEFLTLERGHVRTTPIKGTRRRGRDEAEDRELRRQLETSEKDVAELTMIVDLERNDLGRVAVPGSVRVTAPRRVEAHPTVWHLSAEIEARLEPGADIVDLLRATFPGGSVTGAPKIRAMELIDALEPTARSVFTGAIGVIRPGASPADDELRLSVAIRTMLLGPGWVTFQAGGAVVWDSDPVAEYEETLVKAAAMAAALGLDDWEPGR